MNPALVAALPAIADVLGGLLDNDAPAATAPAEPDYTPLYWIGGGLAVLVVLVLVVVLLRR